jgi:hypothetical protein
MLKEKDPIEHKSLLLCFFFKKIFQLLNEEMAQKSEMGKRVKPKRTNFGSAFLKDAKGTNDWFGHSFTLASNVKVLQRSLRLCPPQP